jgi:hypothetical protein
LTTLATEASSRFCEIERSDHADLGTFFTGADPMERRGTRTGLPQSSKRRCELKPLALAVAALLAGSLPTLSHDIPADVATSPPAGAYKAVSGLVPLPDFLPGLGQLFVDPETLPAGPFLAYDHDGALVSTIYMIAVEDLNPDTKFEDLVAPGGDVDHVDVYFNAGHPGVEVPHAHLVLWHVPAAEEARVAQ